MIDLRKKKITITGGKGFLGHHLIYKLKEDRNCQNVRIADLPEYDLRNLTDIKKWDYFHPPIFIMEAPNFKLQRPLHPIGRRNQPHHADLLSKQGGRRSQL